VRTRVTNILRRKLLILASYWLVQAVVFTGLVAVFLSLSAGIGGSEDRVIDWGGIRELPALIAEPFFLMIVGGMIAVITVGQALKLGQGGVVDLGHGVTPVRAAVRCGTRRAAQACWPAGVVMRSCLTSIKAFSRPVARAWRSTASPGRWPA